MLDIFDSPSNMDAMRAVILDICHNITKFYHWAFLPEALVIYDNNLVYLFHNLIHQMRAIMYIEVRYPIVTRGFFKNNDYMWHLGVDLSDMALNDFIGSHKKSAIINETFVRMRILMSYLHLLSNKSSNDLLHAAIKIANNYI